MGDNEESDPRPRKPLFTKKEAGILGSISENLRRNASKYSGDVVPLTDKERDLADALDQPIIDRPTTQEVCRILEQLLDQAAEAGALGIYEEKRTERLTDAIRLLALAGVIFPLDDRNE